MAIIVPIQEIMRLNLVHTKFNPIINNYCMHKDNLGVNQILENGLYSFLWGHPSNTLNKDILICLQITQH